MGGRPDLLQDLDLLIPDILRREARRSLRRRSSRHGEGRPTSTVMGRWWLGEAFCAVIPGQQSHDATCPLHKHFDSPCAWRHMGQRCECKVSHDISKAPHNRLRPESRREGASPASGCLGLLTTTSKACKEA